MLERPVQLTIGPLKARKGLQMLAILKNFLSAVEGSVQGQLNANELFRSIVTSLSAGTGMGLLLTILQLILSNVATIFPNPPVATLATALITLVIDLIRRQNQGSTPTPTPAPAKN